MSDPIATAHHKRSRRNRRELAIFGAVALVIVGLDQLTKYWAQQYLLPRRLSGEDPITLLGGFLKFTYTENTGAAFSIGTGVTWLFTLIAIAVVLVIFRYARRLGSLPWALALGGILGGSLGNLIDRMFRSPGPFEGAVVDFIQLPYWAIFNIADMAVVISGIGMAILLVRGVPLDGKPEVAGSQVESDL
ncbi:signal peptidase II [Actinomycetota bacterium]|nr:signal peptidase II [Actinomycetota bacterium]